MRTACQLLTAIIIFAWRNAELTTAGGNQTNVVSVNMTTTVRLNDSPSAAPKHFKPHDLAVGDADQEDRKNEERVPTSLSRPEGYFARLSKIYLRPKLKEFRLGKNAGAPINPKKFKRWLDYAIEKSIEKGYELHWSEVVELLLKYHAPLTVAKLFHSLRVVRGKKASADLLLQALASMDLPWIAGWMSNVWLDSNWSADKVLRILRIAEAETPKSFAALMCIWLRHNEQRKAAHSKDFLPVMKIAKLLGFVSSEEKVSAFLKKAEEVPELSSVHRILKDYYYEHQHSMFSEAAPAA